MRIQRAYRTEVDPNNQQRTALLRNAGAARWAYNYGLRRKIDVYKETGRSPSALDLHRELNALKRKPAEVVRYGREQEEAVNMGQGAGRPLPDRPRLGPGR